VVLPRALRLRPTVNGETPVRSSKREGLRRRLFQSKALTGSFSGSMRGNLQRPERIILDGLIAGESYETIAKRMNLTPSMVKMRVLRLRERFSCHSTPQLIAELFRQRLLR